jgi:L-threonylcarbamoyladenylate synthase
MGLILVGSNIEGLNPWIEIDDQQKEALYSKTKRPTTYLIPVTSNAPYWVTGKHSTLAFRFIHTKTVKTLTSILGFPIVSTSANYHGQDPLKKSEDVVLEMSSDLDYIIEGDCGPYNRPSTIVDILSGKKIRK